SFQFRLHPVGAILGGVLVHPMGRARELLRFYSKFVEGAPDELTLFAALGTSPDGVPVAVILAGYFGPVDEGERILRPVREFGPPILDDIKRMSYVDPRHPWTGISAGRTELLEVRLPGRSRRGGRRYDGPPRRERALKTQPGRARVSRRCGLSRCRTGRRLRPSRRELRRCSHVRPV